MNEEKAEKMTIVKIISNPYKREVKFETIDNTTGDWEPVNLHNNPGSRLIKEDIQKNFFPYKVKEILTILQEEYGSDDKTLLVFFEGTADEFVSIYLQNLWHPILLSQAVRGLERATLFIKYLMRQKEKA